MNVITALLAVSSLFAFASIGGTDAFVPTSCLTTNAAFGVVGSTRAGSCSFMSAVADAPATGTAEKLRYVYE